ncbi:hypothetical protein FA95DRAFT_1349093 [Auriscalpium vulgare]|uniref:Uncharacterized protein n=1 Tax=Auriscalpium vulgare TaxID=40419 RepID=A0ACB8R2N7_9AGAM|nr:hypothetical protein FA95DRAFT_1349093 [Auriscalpium vulgare]
MSEASHPLPSTFRYHLHHHPCLGHTRSYPLPFDALEAAVAARCHLATAPLRALTTDGAPHAHLLTMRAHIRHRSKNYSGDKVRAGIGNRSDASAGYRSGRTRAGFGERAPLQRVARCDTQGFCSRARVLTLSVTFCATAAGKRGRAAVSADREASTTSRNSRAAANKPERYEPAGASAAQSSRPA